MRRFLPTPRLFLFSLCFPQFTRQRFIWNACALATLVASSSSFSCSSGGEYSIYTSEEKAGRSMRAAARNPMSASLAVAGRALVRQLREKNGGTGEGE